MVEPRPQPRQPGTDIVPHGQDADSGVPRAVVMATDLAVGAASQATRLAVEVGGRGWNAGAAVGRAVAVLPGAAGAGRLVAAAARPLVSDGRRVRRQARSSAEADTRRLLEAFVPGVVDTLDIDELVRRIEIDGVLQRIDIDALVARIDIDAVVQRIDIDELVQRIDIDRLVAEIDIDRLVQEIDIDALVARIDIDRLVQRIDIDALVARIDIDALVQRIDIDALVQRIDIERLVSRIDIDRLVGRIDIDRLVARIDVNEVVQRVDVDAVVEETAMGSIVARSTSGFASEALDAARSQTAGVDTLVSRAVNRVLRRREGELPVGPPLLVEEGEQAGEDAGGTGVPSRREPGRERDRGDSR